MKKNISLLLGMLTLFALSANGYGSTVTFSDNHKYWGDGTGWSEGQKWATDKASYGWDGNGANGDVIGDPNITGGTAVFTANGKLQKVSFDYYAPYNTWSMLAPGNLFINVLNSSGDTTWDYVVNTMGTPTVAGTKTPDGKYEVYNITSKNISSKRNDGTTVSDANPNYVLSGNDFTGVWAGYIIRDDHPIGINAAGLAGSTNAGEAIFSGFPVVTGLTDDGHPKGTSTYDFGIDGLDLWGKDIILAWETTCANDVLYEQIKNPVPEPGTMVLLGAGLMVLAIYGKRRMKI